MYRYIDACDNSHLIKDEAYNRIKKNLDGFMARLPSSKDKELLFEMVSKVYYKRHKAIQTKSESDTELLLSTLMATLIEQNLEIKRLSNL
jgi:flagellar biosynthesis protein FliP